MIFISKYLVPKGFLGITIFPFVFLNSSELKLKQTLINHEHIHLRQQLELLVIPFYVVYGLEFFIRLLQFKNWDMAYKNISFEREAYDKEEELDYLKHRNIWSFLKYLRANDISHRK